MHLADHGHDDAPTHGAQTRALAIVLVANSALLVLELAGGVAFHSLALLADGAHMVTDVAALAIALLAQRLMLRPSTTRHSYGFQRAEVLAAQANAVALIAAAIWIVVEAARRINDPADVRGGGVLVVALVALVVNAASAWFLQRVQGESLNLRGAFLHMALDAVGSLAALVAGIAVVVWGANAADPVMSIVISLLVVWSAWALLRDATHVLLEGTPRTIDPDAVRAALLADHDVEDVHHLHLWSLASDVPALSAHVVLAGERTLHDAQASGDHLKTLLAERFSIRHATLELECHPCAPETDGAAHPAPAREA
jgi:cobalt-zinc-cadmium efflux system protein